MAFIIGNRLSGAIVGELLNLLCLILPNDSRLPRSKYLFYKHFNIFKDGVQFKYFCPHCNSLLDISDTMQCLICEKEYERKQLLKESNFFIYLQLEKKLQELFHRLGEKLDLSYRFTRTKMAQDANEDIFDGHQRCRFKIN